MPKRKEREEEGTMTTTLTSAEQQLATAKADLASLSRVSHRLAMVDTSEKLTQVLDKLLPRLLKRIGDNQAALAQATNENATHKAVLSQIHAKLVECLVHTSQRVRNDTSSRIPCFSILQLLWEDADASPFTLNLALAFLTTGLGRCRADQQEQMLPLLLQLCSRSRQTQLQSASAATQHYQMTQLLLTCIERLVNSTTTTSRQEKRTTEPAQQPPAAVGKQVSITTAAIMSPLEQARQLCASDPLVAASTYDILLDVLLYQPTTSNVPPAGLSQSGHNRLKTRTFANGNSNSTSSETTTLAALKVAAVEIVSPVRRWSLLFGHHEQHEQQQQLGFARTTALLIVASGDPATTERASMYLKQHLDATATTIATAATTTTPSATIAAGAGEQQHKDSSANNNNSMLPLVIELMALCLGQTHAESALKNDATTAQCRLTGTVLHSTNPQLVLSTKRRPVAEAMQGPLVTFCSKVLEDTPTLFNNNTTTTTTPDVVRGFASICVQVASRSLGASTTGLSRLRAKPYICTAELLNALAIRLGVYYDSFIAKNVTTIGAGKEHGGEIVNLMAQCLSTACLVLSSVSTVSIGTDSRSITANDGSIAVRDACYGVIATLSRSQFAVVKEGYLFCRGVVSAPAAASSSVNNYRIPVSIETATMLFGCAANEQERLRPRAVAALDALLAAYCRAYPAPAFGDSTLKTLPTTSATLDETPAAQPESDNPWLSGSGSSAKETMDLVKENKPVSVDRTGLARSLLPLVWTASQTYQPKASRVAGARWASDLLKQLDDLSAFHLLCFLAGDADVTAASIAREGLGLPKHFTSDDDILATKSTDYSGGSLPDFGAFTELLFPDQAKAKPVGRVQRFIDFSLQGKAATLRFGLYCLLNDLYGGEDRAVDLYLSGIVETLQRFNGEVESGKEYVDLLDECSACLLTTLSASRYARCQITTATSKVGAQAFWIGDLGNLALKARSSRARRYFAGACGKLFEDKSLWISDASDDLLSRWIANSQLATFLATCTGGLDGIEKQHSGLGALHGSSFLGAHIVRAVRLRATSEPTAKLEDEVWTQVGSVLECLGKGTMHAEEIVGNACADSLTIALSYGSPDAPVLDVHLYSCSTSILLNLSKALKCYGHSDTVNPSRASKVARAAGVCLAATTTGSGIVATDYKEKECGNLGPARIDCVEALLEILGSMAFRKEEEISIVVGEALADYSDAYSPENVVWSSAECGEWDSEGFSDEFANQLPPHEQVLYVLLRKVLPASSPHKRTSCAPALLAIVGRGAYRVNSGQSSARRSIVLSLLKHLEEIQKAFIAMLSYPKSKQFSRESCCLGLAACRGLLKEAGDGNQTSSPLSDELNHRLLRAFGQTTNFGGSAYMESQAQAAARREAQGTATRDTEEGTPAESEVGGVSGIGEAALGAYREMAAASVSLGRHDIMYALLFLSVSHSYWFSVDARHRYSAAALMGETSFVGSRTSSSEFRNALRPHLGKLLPRILRACHDPNMQTREQMTSLWTGLTGGGAEGRLAVSQHLLATMDSLIEEASSKLWRARVGVCGALGEIIVGREWKDLGGGGPILSDDDLHDGSNESAGIRLLRIWRVAMRALDDVQGSVRESGETLSRAVKGLTIRLCDPSTEEKSTERALRRDELTQYDHDATAAAATSLRWLIRHGLNQKCAEATGVCVSTLVEVVGVVRPKILEPSLPALINSLLMAISGLEPAALNYVQLRTSDQDGLERLRLQLAQSGPLAVALSKCLALVPFVGLATQQRVAPELDSALRQSAGFASRAATADAVSTLCSTCPAVFRFSGSSTSNPSVRLLRAFYFASERERGAGAKDKMIHALGNLASLCPSGSVRSLAVRACDRYKSSTGNSFDPATRRAAAATLRTIAVRASNHFSDGGSTDIWCRRVLPTAYLGRKDEDPKIASLWKEVWEEGGSAADSSPSMNSFGTRLEERLLSSLVTECVSALQDVSWSRRVAGAAALVDLCDINVLAPIPRSVEPSSKVEAGEMSRARNRAEASNVALQICVNLLTKPRLWSGKAEVLKAATRLSSKWAAAEASIEFDSKQVSLFGWPESEVPCPWRPLSIAPNEFTDDLFAGDSWFLKKVVEVDSPSEGYCGAPLNVADEEIADDHTKIDFDDFDDAEDDRECADEMPKAVEDARSILTFTGFGRFLIDQAAPSPKREAAIVSDDLLPYMTTAFRCLSDLLNSLPTGCKKQRIEIYGLVASKLLGIMSESVDKGVEKKKPPVLVAGAIDCLRACIWDEIGSGDVAESTDPNELTTLLKDVGGKLQPAWTVREASCNCLAQLALKCQDSSIRRHVVVSQMVDAAKQAVADGKFWRVRIAGLKILESLVSRAGPGHNSSKRTQLILEALLPQKEAILALLRLSVSDSESRVAAQSTNLISSMAWWP